MEKTLDAVTTMNDLIVWFTVCTPSAIIIL